MKNIENLKTLLEKLKIDNIIIINMSIVDDEIDITTTIYENEEDAKEDIVKYTSCDFISEKMKDDEDIFDRFYYIEKIIKKADSISCCVGGNCHTWRYNKNEVLQELNKAINEYYN